MKNYIHSSLLKLSLTRIICFIIFSALITNIAWANLLIVPTRVVIQEKQKSASVILINMSNLTTTYQLHWVQKKQMPDGRLINIPSDSAEVRSASTLLKFSPHQITLAANRKQIVRIVLKEPIDFKARELRSHLSFLALSDIEKNDFPFNIGPPIQSQFMKSFSIPVIIRQGDLNASAKITSIKPRKAVVGMGNISYSSIITLSGAGVNTAIGTLKVLWKSNNSGDYRIIGNLNDVTLYPESTLVQFHVGLNIINPSKGYMKVIYAGTNEFKGTTFGEYEIPVLLSDFKFEIRQ